MLVWFGLARTGLFGMVRQTMFHPSVGDTGEGRGEGEHEGGRERGGRGGKERKREDLINDSEKLQSFLGPTSSTLSPNDHRKLCYMVYLHHAITKRAKVP